MQKNAKPGHAAKMLGGKKKAAKQPPPSPSLNTLPHTGSLIKTLAM